MLKTTATEISRGMTILTSFFLDKLPAELAAIFFI
jgi:hypothetical protein